MQFKVGDIVECCGVRGVVDFVHDDNSKDYPVDCSFQDGAYEDSFTPDGRVYTWHELPTLKLIERPKKSVEVTRDRLISIASKWRKTASRLLLEEFICEELGLDD